MSIHAQAFAQLTINVLWGLIMTQSSVAPPPPRRRTHHTQKKVSLVDF